MITADKIKQLADSLLQEGENELYVVEVKVSPGFDIEIIVDCDTRVTIDECAKLSRKIDSELEAQGYDDFSIVVASAGIGSELKLDRQVQKCWGKVVEVVKKDGVKLVGELAEGSTTQSITLKHTVKETVEGKKRKEEVQKVETFAGEDVKSVKEMLTIK